MATRRWRGNAPAIAQVTAITIRDVSDGIVVTLTKNGKSIQYTAETGDDAEDVGTALAELWNAETDPRFTEVTAAGTASGLTLTADTAGVPFTVTATKTGTGGNAEVKTVTINNSPTGGTWTWQDSEYGNASGLAYNISSANLQTALEVVYGAGNVTVTGSSGGPYTVTFANDLAATNIPDITFVNTSLTGGNAAVSIVETTAGNAGTNEVQTITFYGSPSGGSSYWTFDGFTTGAIAYNANAATVQAALEALPSIGSGNVSVSGTGPYVVTFQGALAATAVPAIQVDASGLTGGTIYGTLATTTPGVAGTNEVQYIRALETGTGDEYFTIDKSGTVSGGTFRIEHDGEYSSAIAYNATAREIAAVLDEFVEEQRAWSGTIQIYNQLFGFDTQTVSGSSSVGFKFWGALGGQNIGLEDTTGTVLLDLTIDSASLTGGGSYAITHQTSGASGDGGYASTLGYTLSYGSETTSNLTLASTAAQVQAALEALPSIGSGNVEVTAITGQTGDSTSSRGLFKVEFIRSLKGTNVAKLTSTPATNMTTAGWEVEIVGRANGVAGTNEVQTLTLAGTPSAGNFTLTYGTETTANIAYNAAASAVDSALEALTGIAAGDVTCAGGALPGTPVTITFTGNLSYTNVGLIVLNDNGLKVQVVETTPGVAAQNEVQTVSLTGSPHGGTFTLTYDGDTTASIAYNASAATVETELEAIASIGSGQVSVTGSAGGPWAVEFIDTLAETDLAMMTAADSLHNGTVTETSADPITVTTTTANQGPNDWNTTLNWSGETLPVSTDTVIIDQGDVAIKYGLDQSSVTLAALTVEMGYSGEIGLPDVNTDSLDGTQYAEFRDQYLKISATTLTVGSGSGSGSGRIKINTGTVQTTVNVLDTGPTVETGVPSFLWLGTHSSNAFNISKGSAGIAIFAGEAATAAQIRVGYRESINGDANLRCGSGCTLTDVDQSGGTLEINSNITTAEVTNGELIFNAGTMGTLQVDAGVVRYRSTGTMTTGKIGSGASLDFRQDMRGRTVTNLELYEESEYHDPHGTVTLSNGIDFVRCTPSEVILDVIPHRTWTPSAI